MKKQFTYFNTKTVDYLTKPTEATKAEISLLTSSTVTDAYSWVDLNKQFLQGNIPDAIACGVSQIFEKDPDEFLSTLYTIINAHNKDKKISLCVPANDELEYDQISSLREFGFKGLVPPTPYYGSQASATSIQYFLNDQEYWPEFIIDNYKEKQESPTILVFNNIIKDQLNLSVFKFYLKNRNNNKFKIDIACTWEELTKKLRNRPTAVLFHADVIEDSVSEFVSTLESLIKFSHPRRKVPVGINIDATTSISLIKELQNARISGIVPAFSSWGEEECLEGINHLLANSSYWPKHILNQLPGYKIKFKSEEIELSYRQQQILNMIQTQGITNRQIADTLKIKEGTVKLHVGVLLKKYAVQNRTQLANL